MPRPNDSPDVAASKTLSYILRHGAEKEGLHIRSDGYIKLDDVLARPKMRAVDKIMVLRLVAENAKKRFELFYGYDPSPPPLKKGKGKAQGSKGGASGKKKEEVVRVSKTEGEGEAEAQDGQALSRGAGKEGKEGKADKRNRRAAKLSARADGTENVDKPKERSSIRNGEETGSRPVASQNALHADLDQDAERTPNPRAEKASAEDESSAAPRLDQPQSPALPPSAPKSLAAKPPKGKVKADPAPTHDSSISTELPLVPLPIPEDVDSATNPVTSAAEQDVATAPMADVTEQMRAAVLTKPATADPASPPTASTPSSAPLPAGEYFIRASQGHSIALASTAHLTRIAYAPDSTSVSPSDRARAGLMVHGTHAHLYPLIASSGLSRMGRQHIHLAPALEVGGDMDNVIAPRNGSTLLIYLDLDKMLERGLEVYVSANGVVLTPGDVDGRVGREVWKMVERVERGERRVIWDAERGDVE